ncbi:MAG TPA: hypothetical protein VLA56_11585 [Pseudomonadales bacterium]|nr:hypothetical protein [Pseudomonadales bacterium]
MKTYKIARSIALVSALIASGSALAANDGTRGLESTGDLQVTLSVNDRVQITRLNDIALGAFSGTGDLVGADGFCAYRNGSGLYDLTVSSANAAAGVFRAVSGTDFLAYTVKVDQDADASDGTLTTSGAVQAGLAGSGTSTTCANSDNAAVEVTFAEADLQAAPTGAYVDTLTLLVQPN